MCAFQAATCMRWAAPDLQANCEGSEVLALEVLDRLLEIRPHLHHDNPLKLMPHPNPPVCLMQLAGMQSVT